MHQPRIPKGSGRRGGQFAPTSLPESLAELSESPSGQHRALKDLGPTDLAEAIRDEMWRDHGDSDAYALTSEAIDLAHQLHEGQRRAAPTITTSGSVLPGSEPYVVHPLRNALRIVRWGESDPDIVVAAVLHDVVEDQAYRLAATGNRSVRGLGAAGLRAEALHVVDDTFGADVARTVEAVSNPLPQPGVVLSREQKRDRYVAHVEQSIGEYPPFMVKAADFVDNALGLHHQNLTAASTRFLAWKYRPLCEPFARAAGVHQKAGHLLHADLVGKLAGADAYLGRILSHPRRD